MGQARINVKEGKQRINFKIHFAIERSRVRCVNCEFLRWYRAIYDDHILPCWLVLVNRLGWTVDDSFV
jgi:hypothetical protein